MAHGARLLILSCSHSKRLDQEPLPAIERYNGPAFRVLRRFLSNEIDAELTTYILSAEFGLISSDHPIPHYDQRMTPQRALALHHSLMADFRLIVAAAAYQEMCLCVGQDYFEAMTGYTDFLPPSLEVNLAFGGTGARLSRLHKWLHGDGHNASLPAQMPPQNPVSLCGKEHWLDIQQIFNTARQAISDSNKSALAYTTWYVDVDGKRISPKWLVSKVTGVHVGEFHTDAARRLLGQIGVEVKKI